MPLRILIVEDIFLTRDQLKKLIAEEIPGSEIVAVESVGEGHREIEKLLARDLQFDAAVLDLNIPKEHGGPPEFDESLFTTVSRDMPETLLIAVSAHSDFMQVLEAKYRPPSDTPVKLLSLFIHKKDVDWAHQLIRALKSHLYGQPIRRELRELFGASGRPNAPVARRGGAARRGGLTHRLEALISDIRKHWEDLDNGLRAEIQEYFDVIPAASDEPRRVGLRGF